jgi:SAM-dependent methyltransferase
VTTFADHFSDHARDYASARPHYPATLFAWLADQCAQRGLAWDAGCGNGQASVALAEHFAHVHASDPSAAQIAQGTAHPRVHYAVEPAEATSLPAQSVDLISVAQAFHWFDHPRFFAEVRRVARPGAVVAVYSYERTRVTPAVDAWFAHVYVDVLGHYWPPERRHVESGYRSLPFPFNELPSPPVFELHCDWRLPQYLAYLRSWSACQKYLTQHGHDPLAALEPALHDAWGDPAMVRAVHWPLNLRVGIVE